MHTTNSSLQHFFGIDVAKAELVVHGFGERAVHALPNTAKDIERWLDALPENSAVAVESTGSFYLGVARACVARGIPVYVLNAQRVRHYAKGVGRGAKTDRLDAQVISRYLAHEHAKLHPWTPLPEPLARLSTLLTLRDTLVRSVQSTRQSCKALGFIPTDVQLFLRSGEALARGLEREATKIARAHAPWRELLRRLRTVPGIGPLNGLALLLALHRHPLTRVDAFIALTGLDPRPCDSGQRRGRRALSKCGDALLRKLLHTAAMAAVGNPLFAPDYQRLQSRGLSKTAALVVIARKLARIAWGIFRSGKDFDPQILRARAGIAT